MCDDSPQGLDQSLDDVQERVENLEGTEVESVERKENWLTIRFSDDQIIQLHEDHWEVGRVLRL